MHWLIRRAFSLMGVMMASSTLNAREPSFRVQEIDKSLTVGYAVRLIDMNADGRLDILVADSRRVIWFENPSWALHTIAKDQPRADNVCLAPHDIDGDGKIDFALGADWKFSTQTPGIITWHRGVPGSETWPSFSLGEVPFVHRMRWLDIDDDGQPELLVLPLLGPGKDAPARITSKLALLAFRIPQNPAADRWTAEPIVENLTVAHNFCPADLDKDGKPEILVASYQGVTLATRKDGKWSSTVIGSGNQSPSRTDRLGASEIKYGILGNSDYIATIEPWHGYQVVVYTRPAAGEKLWRRHVIDEDLQWGHAVWCADLDGDADQELVIGVRDNFNQFKCGLRIYDPVDANAGKWERSIIDPGGVAIEDLAVGDLDNNGAADVVAVGRATRNVRIYWNKK